MSLLRALSVLLIGVAALHADVSGTVTGRVMVTDNRAAVAGSLRPAAPGAVVGFPRAVVAVAALSRQQATDGNNDCCVGVNPTTFAVTDANGNFSANWRDRTGSGLPVRLRIEVLMTYSNQAGGGTEHPDLEFQIVSFPNTSQSQIFRRTIEDADAQLGTFTLSANDETAAYLTVREVWRNIVRFSNRLESRMPGLVVKTRVPGFSLNFGVAPFRHEVLVAENTPRTVPLTVAHEVGHAITWAALQLHAAPLNPATDYGLDLHWERDTRESSKAAFLEGMADFWSIVWAFGSNRNVTITRGSKTFRHEQARVLDSSGSILLRCSTVSNAHEFPFCHTAALLDLVDDDPTGGDGVDLRISTIVNILNGFPNNCLNNGCRDELGWDGLNHKDFLRNAPASLRPRIRGVWRLNGLDTGN